MYHITRTHNDDKHTTRHILYYLYLHNRVVIIIFFLPLLYISHRLDNESNFSKEKCLTNQLAYIFYRSHKMTKRKCDRFLISVTVSMPEKAKFVVYVDL